MSRHSSVQFSSLSVGLQLDLHRTYQSLIVGNESEKSVLWRANRNYHPAQLVLGGGAFQMSSVFFRSVGALTDLFPITEGRQYHRLSERRTLIFQLISFHFLSFYSHESVP